MVAPNTGVLTDALASAAIDVAFMPVDEERKKRLEFGPAYCLVESTYMVTAASGVMERSEVLTRGHLLRSGYPSKQLSGSLRKTCCQISQPLTGYGPFPRFVPTLVTNF